MRRLLVIAALGLLLALALPVSAQVVANDAYFLGYYDHFGVQEDLYIINTGQVGSPIDAATKQGTICADIYLFDNNQEMLSCCSCPITANGLSHSFTGNLLTSALTGFPQPETGVIKVVADRAAQCDPRSIVSPVEGGLRVMGTHTLNHVEIVCVASKCEVIVVGNNGATETEYQRAPLMQAEMSFLGNACSFVQYLGSGRGVCRCGVTG